MSRNVELTVSERLIVQQLLPEKSNFINIKLLRKLREELSFSAEELKLLKIKQTGQGSIKWDTEAAEECKKIVAFNSHTSVMVIDKLNELEKEGKLAIEHISLYEKFVLVEDKKDKISEKAAEAINDVLEEVEKVAGKIETKQE